MTDILWNGIQHISDKWIIKADEDAVKEHFQADDFHGIAGGGNVVKMHPKPAPRRTVLRWLSAAACICLCLCAAVVIRHFGTSPVTPPKMASAVMEVASSVEMNEYLGYTVPMLEGKTADAYILRTSGEYAETGSVLYSDGSSFQITRKGSEPPEDSYTVENISGVPVYFGWEDGHQYAAWTHNGYSCRYCDYDTGGGVALPNSATYEESDYVDEINSLILQLK